MEEDFNLSGNELILFSKLRSGTIDEIRTILDEPDVRIDCLDDHAMTPLQHAAYKGDYELCKLFLDRGANINVDRHDHNYTPLMFAALSNKTDVVSLMLENGANAAAVNSINRTASQLAGFIGNYQIVSLISNYVPIEQIFWYTELQDKEEKPKLPEHLGKLLHQFVVIGNTNPVFLAMHLQSNPILLDEHTKITKVLVHFSGKLINDDSNETLSIKLHHFAFVLIACSKYLDELKQKLQENESLPENLLERLIKHWIKEDDKLVQTGLEKLMRQSIKEYPFPDSAVFQQLVRTLAPLPLGADPTAAQLFCQSVSGQRETEGAASCWTCGEPRALKKCSVCKSVQYCNKDCQKLHWSTHKKSCQSLLKSYLEKKEMAEKGESQILAEDLLNVNIGE